MSDEPTNSFGTRHSDYAFFLDRSTEPERCREAVLAELQPRARASGDFRLLDFGCGCGEFLDALLADWGRPAEGLEVTLVDVDKAGVREAAARIERHCAGPAATAQAIGEIEGPFDFIVSNHVFYYVEDPAAVLRALAAKRAPGGTGVVILGGEDNQLCRLWRRVYEGEGRVMPFHLADDIAGAFACAGISVTSREVRSMLRFEDNSENRSRLIRFLFGGHLEGFDAEQVMAGLDDWKAGSEIVMPNTDVCFVFAEN